MAIATPVNVRMPPDLLKLLKERAAKHNTNASAIIVAALRTALDAPSPESLALGASREERKA